MKSSQLGVGIGFRMHHFAEIQRTEVPIDWFELITEHFLTPAKKSRLALEYLKARFPLVLHGVSLAIGSPTSLDFNYLSKVKALAREVDAPWVSDHLCWGQLPGGHFHSLLPLPFRKDVADYVAERARIVQDYLEIPFALENLSSCIEAEDKEMEEWDFYSYVIEKAGISMMLDVNNIYVSSQNLDFDPEHYLSSLPFEKIIQIHLAGHTQAGEWLIDTHDHPVKDEVWDLYKRIWALANRPATMLEWDQNFLSFEETCKEALKAKQFQEELANV